MPWYRIRPCLGQGAHFMLNGFDPKVVIIDESVKERADIMRRCHGKCPVIIASTKSEEELRVLSEFRSVSGFISKPYGVQMANIAISRAINKQVQRAWLSLEGAPKDALFMSSDIFDAMGFFGIPNGQLNYKSLKEASEQIIQTVIAGYIQQIIGGIEEHTTHTFAHSMKAAAILAYLARELKMSPEEEFALTLGGLIHDAGKAGLPDVILNKP